jgi:hypothetical protein
LVLCHEEFAAAPAAKVFGLPTVFLIDWFAGPEHLWMQCLNYADEIVFIDEPGIFTVPHYIAKGTVHYVGPLIRKFAYSRADRDRARRELGLNSDIVVSILPGRWATEERAPIFDLVMPAFRALACQRKTLLWIADQDYEDLARRADNCADVVIKRVDWQIDRLMVASNLSITKANRKTCIELAALGIPSISLSYGLNAMDDIRVEKIATNIHLNAKRMDSAALATHMTRLLEVDAVTPNLPLPEGGGLQAAAGRVREHIARVRVARQ